MSERKETWTKGPWTYQPHKSWRGWSGWQIVATDEDGDGIVVAEFEATRKNGENDARLIAAAPDLYEALDFAMHALMGMREAFVEMEIHVPPTLDSEIDRARSALLLAHTGGTENG